MDGADALQKTHRGQVLLAWRNPVTGETRAGGAIHADLISVEELDEVLEAAEAEAGRKTKMIRIRLAGMGFWDVDRKEFLTKHEATERGRTANPDTTIPPVVLVVPEAVWP
jgi:hypothetical protein